jgi:hypothetical protein
MVVGISSANKGQDKNCSPISFAVQIFGAFYLNLDNQQASFDEIIQ